MEYSSLQQAPGTLRAYRIVAPKWASSALSGEGARLYGGRWNSPGRPLVYLATSRALAALELLVHLSTPASRRLRRTLVTVEIPEDLIGGEFFEATGWRDQPPGQASMEQGDDWLKVASTAGVLAPSAIIPAEKNVLLNPLHVDFTNVRVVRCDDFFFDSRLAEKSGLA